ncbi:MFS transporter [Streptomyces sp. NBC_01190]|uniref:MFS transporter n=1 Tax=Streptomyces sp. NBC_01190 TaxID=2903767 RepID=UPI00386D58A5|nr:MFS transporter [Streptomyces sp. NBC_01190]
MTTASPPLADPSASRTTYRQVLTEPRFRLLFSTRTLGVIADSLRVTTFSALVYAGTGSALLSALAFGAGFLPQLFGSLLLGSLADRLPPRALIAGGYLLEGAAAALLAFVRMPIAVGLAVIGAVALVTPAFSGASARLVARWLDGDAYVLGRSLNNMAASGAQLIGLMVGGAAVAAAGPRAALAAGAAAHLLCAAVVRLRLPRLEAEPVVVAVGAGGGAVRDSLRGAGALLRHRAVRRLLFAQWLPSAFVAGAEGMIVAYAGGRHFAAGSYAVLMACLPVGMLLGDLVVGRWLRPAIRERLVVPLIVLMGLPLLGFAADPGRALSAGLLLLAGLGFANGLGLQREFLDALPEEGQGQAFGLLGSGNMTLQGLGPVAIGAIAAPSGTGAAMALAGLGTLLTAAWILSWRRPRPTPKAAT